MSQAELQGAVHGVPGMACCRRVLRDLTSVLDVLNLL